MFRPVVILDWTVFRTVVMLERTALRTAVILDRTVFKTIVMLGQAVFRTIVILDRTVFRTIVMLERTVFRNILMLDECNKASVLWFRTGFPIIKIRWIGQCLQILPIFCKNFYSFFVTNNLSNLSLQITDILWKAEWKIKSVVSGLSYCGIFVTI